MPRRRWRIAWLLGLGVLVNYFDRVNLAVSHAALYTTFGISTVTFGYLSGAYNWTYALCQLPVGVLLDKFGIRRVGRVSIFLWSIASFAAAITPGLGGFFAARLLLGVGEAPTFPANAKAVGYWFPQGERSFATSIFDSAAKFASAIGSSSSPTSCSSGRSIATPRTTRTSAPSSANTSPNPLKLSPPPRSNQTHSPIFSVNEKY